MLAAISRLPRPAAFSRRASLILRMESLFLGTQASLSTPVRAVDKGGGRFWWMRRRRPECRGQSVVRFRPDRVSGFIRIRVRSPPIAHPPYSWFDTANLRERLGGAAAAGVPRAPG